MESTTENIPKRKTEYSAGKPRSGWTEREEYLLMHQYGFKDGRVTMYRIVNKTQDGKYVSPHSVCAEGCNNEWVIGETKNEPHSQIGLDGGGLFATPIGHLLTANKAVRGTHALAVEMLDDSLLFADQLYVKSARLKPIDAIELSEIRRDLESLRMISALRYNSGAFGQARSWADVIRILSESR